MGSGRRCKSRLIFTFTLLFIVQVCVAQNTTKTSNRRGKALNISRKPCSDPTGLKGICTFKWDCINQNGTKIGTCMDGFIVGTCCNYLNDPLLSSNELQNQLNNNIYISYQKHKYHKPYKNDDNFELLNETTFTTAISLKPTTVNPTIPNSIPTSASTSLNQQLVTWAAVGPTKISNQQRPAVTSKFPFATGISYPQFQVNRWPIGIAVPVNPFQQYRPSYHGTYFQSSNLNKAAVKKRPTLSGNFTIFSKTANSSKNSSTSTIEMTTISVPIPQWTSTKTAGSITGPIINTINRLPIPTTVKPGTPFKTNTVLTTSKPSTTASISHASSSPQLQKKKKPPLDYRKDCGVRALGPRARIVGGINSHFGRWPWQILVKEAAWLGLYHKNKCGGVLISSKYAITAGHCQPGFLSSLVVLLGEYDLATDFEVLKPEMRRVKRMVVHRHYNPQNFDNDIAILELDPPVVFRPHISPICLPKKDEDFTGKMAYVTGWGKTTHGGSIPNLLQEVQVPIVSNTKCLEMFKKAGHIKIIKENFLCAGYETGGKDSCEGDSGGPLMVQREDGQWVLAGTVSHGIRCADPNLPGVYMRISSYRTWIDKIIGSN